MVPNNPVTTSDHYDVLPVPLIHLGAGQKVQKYTLNSQLQALQILTNDDKVEN